MTSNNDTGSSKRGDPSQIGLHENVVALDYDSEYANLIVNHNLSYETVTLEEGGKGVVVQKQQEQQ